MHRDSLVSFVSVSLLVVASACSKEKPAPPAPAATSTEEVSAPIDPTETVTSLMTTPKLQGEGETAPPTPEVAATPPAPDDVKPAANESAGEPAAAKTEEKVAEG
ncbi:MAG TPA: hypothetical protein VM509_11860, partial [Planctomycetota bacterium]|nr:hypothetical protein [Planctomycetota bacterium]